MLNPPYSLTHSAVFFYIKIASHKPKLNKAASVRKTWKRIQRSRRVCQSAGRVATVQCSMLFTIGTSTATVMISEIRSKAMAGRLK